MVAFYYILRQQVDHNINLEMEKRKTSISKELDSVHSSIRQPANLDEKVLITPLTKPMPRVSLSDTLLYNQEDNQCGYSYDHKYYYKPVFFNKIYSRKKFMDFKEVV